ncbi:MAG: glycosyltransferase [Deltaproteobacteria bacterium]|nr:glycosyltransferase [Deltaproteobacteria bacterium]
MTDLLDVGCVVIGRNEGERLVHCLTSVVREVAHDRVVYVDSQSTDDSVGFARGLGIEVVELDLSRPFTAARARNEGFERLMAIASRPRTEATPTPTPTPASTPTPGLESRPGFEPGSLLAYVQFIDGDCEIVPGWLARGRARLIERKDLAVVCGRRREKYPGASIYNRLCDLEWDTPVGEAEACGGDALMRIEAFQRAEGFNASLICGEEPDLCLRLRRLGYAVERLDAEMTRHDAAMAEFHQWWKRSVRAGYAYAEGASNHADGDEAYSKKDVRSILFWGALPAVALGAGVPTLGLSLCMLGAYPLGARRIYQGERARGRSPSDALLYASFCMLGKFPELQGLARYYSNRLRGRASALIEYK